MCLLLALCSSGETCRVPFDMTVFASSYILFVMFGCYLLDNNLFFSNERQKGGECKEENMRGGLEELEEGENTIIRIY